MSFFFDHAYIKTKSDTLYDDLLSRGFSSFGRTVEHPGSLKCQFIGFPRSGSSDPEGRQYLEFATVRDFQELRNYQEKRRKRALSDDELLVPGFSLGFSGGLEQAYEKLMAPFSDLGIKFEHKNYEWQVDSESRLPGWNFLTFEEPILSGAYVWATEYERHPSRPGRPPLTPHRNSAARILGFLWGVNGWGEMGALPRLLGNDSQSDGGLDGSLLWFKSAIREAEAKLRFQDKVSPFWAVVLECESLERFIEVAQPDYEMKLDRKHAAGIRLDRHQWDILAIEKE